MSLLTLSKRILGKDTKAAPVKNKKLKTVATKAAKKNKPVDAHALTTGIIGLSEVVSEKAILQQGQNTAVFTVMPHVTKGQIAQAIEARYGVKVKSVRTALSHPRSRRRGITAGRVNYVKKAYVTVDSISALIS